MSEFAIALADCNNFYVSCERTIDDRLHGRPVVVLSNNDGCVIARSYEAKAMGVQMGEAFHLKRREYERKGVMFRSSNYPLYFEKSQQVMETLGRFAVQDEYYSIDEVFLLLNRIPDLAGYAREIQRTVKAETGIPVSIGIAETKTLAKIANNLAKNSPKIRDHVLDLTGSPYQEVALARTPVGKVWGVGYRLAKKLEKDGIQTALELRDTDVTGFIVKKYGVILGRTVTELQGIRCLPLLEGPPLSKMIMTSLSFGRSVTDIVELRQAVSAYTAHCATRLRAEKLAALTVYLYIQTNRYSEEEQHFNHAVVRLPLASFDTSELIAAALQGLESIHKPGVKYYKVGVMLNDLVPQETLQLSLFHEPDERSGRLMTVQDQINETLGEGVLRYAVEGFNKDWMVRRQYASDDRTPNFKKRKNPRQPIVQFGTSSAMIQGFLHDRVLDIPSKPTNGRGRKSS